MVRRRPHTGPWICTSTTTPLLAPPEGQAFARDAKQLATGGAKFLLSDIE
jgi:hypothetical protein